MSLCEHLPRVSTFHDGELSPDERRAFAAHLDTCAVCTRELEQLRPLSPLLAAVGIPDAPAPVLERLHAGAAVVGQRVVVRMAEVLTTAAAVVLVVCGSWLWHGPGAHEAPPTAASPWERAAVTLSVETSASEPQQFAQWIVQDLAGERA